MALPKDPYILLSYLNTQLRDKYVSLAALCDDLEEDQSALEAIMQTVQYHYDVNRNNLFTILKTLFVPENIKRK